MWMCSSHFGSRLISASFSGILFLRAWQNNRGLANPFSAGKCRTGWTFESLAANAKTE
jgi:hypothetical protein